MKITGIDIGEYRQFKNIKFDFTYPADYHVVEKRGLPLEKVCFIGQSGTGKTTLLNVIWDFFMLFVGYPFYPSDVIKYEDQIDFSYRKRLTDSVENLESISINSEFTIPINLYDLVKPEFSRDYKNLIDAIHLPDKLCLYLKDSISREADAFLADQRELPQTFSDIFKTTTQIEENKEAFQDRIEKAGAKQVVSLGDMKSLSIWQYLLKEIISYDGETPRFMVNLGSKARESSSKTLKDLEDWLAKNPRIELEKECLSPLLDKLFLELDLVGEDGAFLALQTKQGSKIPNNTLSTGTRQLLATAIPIYKFDTKGTVILFDEPERSLFPDIQRELVKYYTSLAPEAQFFFATHSPIIAAAFEPEERFILYFDENGEVKYRKGEAPIGDDPNDILSADFGLNELMGEAGVAAYREYLDLVSEIKNEPDKQSRMKLIAKRAALGNKYNFTTTTPDETN